MWGADCWTDHWTLDIMHHETILHHATVPPLNRTGTCLISKGFRLPLNGKQCMSELQYVDDCTLVTHTPEALQMVLTARLSYNSMGLSVNISKTEVLSQLAFPASTTPTFTKRDEPLSVVPSFKYLGSIISHNCSIQCEIKIKQSSSSFGRLQRRVFLNKNLSLHTMIAVYQAVCITTLLYDRETSTLYLCYIQKLGALQIKFLQCILGMTHPTF